MTGGSGSRLSSVMVGYNKPKAKISEGVRESLWLQGMMAGFPASDCRIKTVSETDLTEDRKRFDVPTLILHGGADQTVSIGGFRHHVAGACLVRYAQESAWREDHRRVDNGRQVQGVIGLAMACKPSVDFCGYWQRAQKGA
jgi:pimeloyl-ACP methyl ester carboxylesterase